MGDILNFPGFCFNRVTDFQCYIWVEPLAHVADDAVIGSEEASYPDGFDKYDVQYGIPDAADYVDLDYLEETVYTYDNMTEDYYDNYWDFYPDYLETDLADSIYIYVSPVFLLIGTFGNILSFMVLCKMQREVLTTCIYLAVLCLVDLIILYIRCGNDWLVNMASLDLSNRLMVYSESFCKVYPFFFNFVCHLSKWLIVSMTIEAFIHVRYPSRAIRLCTRERAQAVLFLLTVLLIMVNVHYFWSFNLVPLKELSMSGGLFCTFTKHGHQHSEEFQMIIWPIIELVVAEILPYTTVIASAIIMLIQVIRGRHKGDFQHQQWQEKYLLDAKAVNQLKIMFLCICIAYVVLTLPKFTYVIFKYMVENYDLIEYSFKYESQRRLAHAVCSSLEYVFLSCKILIYMIPSECFRKELKSLFSRSSRSGDRKSRNTSKGGVENGSYHTAHQCLSPDIEYAGGSPALASYERDDKVFLQSQADQLPSAANQASGMKIVTYI